MKNNKALIGAIMIGLAMGFGVFFWQNSEWMKPVEVVKEEVIDIDEVERPQPGTPGTVVVLEPDPLVIEAQENSVTPSSGDLVGSWTVQNENFDSVTLNIDGTFSTFLHDRPFNDGVWFMRGLDQSSSGLTLDASSGEDLDVYYPEVWLLDGELVMNRHGYSELLSTWAPIK